MLSPIYAVEVLGSGAAALERSAQAPLPDAILLDWRTPDLSGLVVCEFFRKSQTTGVSSVLA